MQSHSRISQNLVNPISKFSTKCLVQRAPLDSGDSDGLPSPILYQKYKVIWIHEL